MSLSLLISLFVCSLLAAHGKDHLQQLSTEVYKIYTCALKFSHYVDADHCHDYHTKSVYSLHDGLSPVDFTQCVGFIGVFMWIYLCMLGTPLNWLCLPLSCLLFAISLDVVYGHFTVFCKWRQHSHWMLVLVISILDPKHPSIGAFHEAYFDLYNSPNLCWHF